MTCKQGFESRGVAAQDAYRVLVLPIRMVGDGKPDAPVQPEERPTLPPVREDPHYPTHTPPNPGTSPSQPCPGTDDPDEEFPACRG